MERSLTILENTPLAPGVFRLLLDGAEADDVRAPGQFFNLSVDGFYLRRPISVCRYVTGKLTLVYKTVGKGTEQMSRMKKGETLNALVGLGNGFDTSKSGQTPLLIGGGVGTPPMLGLCENLVAEGKSVSVIIGFNTKDEVFHEDEFKKAGAKVFVATADGSYGEKGFVTDVMKHLDYSYVYTCGPEPMFCAVNAVCKTSGQFSFEERMGCGFGACMGCSCKTLYGNKRICRDGPVLEREEIIWKD
mgnify:CR=1 FL=1